MSSYVSITDDNESDLTLATFLVEQEGYVVIGRGDGYGTLDAIADLDVFLFIHFAGKPRPSGRGWIGGVISLWEHPEIVYIVE